MAEQVGKFLTELPELETPTDDDAMYIVDGSTASKKITMSNLKRILGGNVTGTVEDASVSFSDGADGIPMEECEVTIVPSQDLHGYSKPWAGGAGKNKLSDTWSDYTTYGSYRYIKIHNFVSGDYIMSFTDNDTSVDLTGIYIGFMYDYPDQNTQYRWCLSNGVIQSNTTNTSAIDNTTKCDTIIILPNTEATFNKLFQRYHIQVESGTTATTYEPYSNICPISGHTDVTVTVASTSGGSGDDTTVSLGRTVYSGTLDINTGVLTVDKGFRTYTGATSENWIYTSSLNRVYINIPDAYRPPTYVEIKSNILHFAGYVREDYGAYINGQGNLIVYAPSTITSASDWKTWLTSNNLQVVYELATPQTYQLTPAQVTTLLGQNYVSHNGGGNIKVVYIRDLDITINDLINRVTALENE